MFLFSKSIPILSASFMLTSFPRKTLFSFETQRKPYLGASIRAEEQGGMKVIMIQTNSPADSHLQVGDIIIAIEDFDINNISDYYGAIGRIEGAKRFRVLRKIKGRLVEKEVIINIELL